jgi:hypothetical protein
MKGLLDPIFPKEETIRSDAVDDIHHPRNDARDEE